MAPQIVNVLLTSFPGLELPATLSFPVDGSTSLRDLTAQISDCLPQVHTRLILTTTSNKEISALSSTSVSSLIANPEAQFLCLRLSVPLCGGKGGFGSQLRAAGGRMSSRRKNNQGESNSSNRNLDGRRLRTVAEAKALAEYLALKPEMEKKEKEARRKRWEQIVELADKKEYEIKNGTRGRVDGKWVEDKEETGEKTREAVFAAMKSGNYHDNFGSISKSILGSESDSSSNEGSEDNKSQGSKQCMKPALPISNHGASSSRRYYGFDQDDEFMTEEEVEETENEIENSQMKVEELNIGLERETRDKLTT